jgi:hypothetical protein
MEHFERAAGVIAKSPPPHRVAKKKSKAGKEDKKNPAEAGLILSDLGHFGFCVQLDAK